MDRVYTASVTAPVNIATLKYWGKRDPGLNLPTNSSISVTLSQDDLRTTTTAAASAQFGQDELWLNGKQEDVNVKRIQQLFKGLRGLRRELEQKLSVSSSNVVPLSEFCLHIVSENNFPTAAGLASSAAGYAALVKALASLYELPQTDEELSVWARQGSGSACRSLFGGFVAWEMGSREDGLDSKAVQIAPVEYWPQIKAAILVVSADEKDTSSTTGMQVTVKTSPLFKERISSVVPHRFEEMKKAILAHDFATFAQLTMQDSNSFHAVCLDSTPPIFYLNDVSRSAIRVVEKMNSRAGKPIAAYTFDAGPNAVIFYEEQNEQEVLGPIKTILRKAQGWEDSGIGEADADFDKRWIKSLREGVGRVILTRVGGSPKRTSLSLVDKTGAPVL